MSERNRNRFDIMAPFFNAGDDRRYGLYLDVLEQEFNATKEIKITKVPDEFKNRNFEGARENDDIHPEWGCFFKGLTAKFNASNQNDVVNFINTIGDKADSTMLPFFKAVILAHLGEMKGTYNGTVLDKNSFEQGIDWGSEESSMKITSIKFIADSLSIVTDGPTKERLAGVDVSVCKLDATKFSFLPGKDWLRRRLEAESAVNGSASDEFWASKEPVNNIYFRLASDPKKLYTNEKGTNVEVSKGSLAMKEIEKDNCAGTKVKPNGDNTCGVYLDKCMTNGSSANIEACKDFMSDSNFWKVTLDEVAQMLPYIAVSTLDKFGFKVVVNSDNNKCYETVDSWLSHLKNASVGATAPLSPEEFVKISKNTQLIEYLKLVVNKVNGSPSILNENYFNKSQVSERSDFQLNNSYLVKVVGMPGRLIIAGNDSNQGRELNLGLDNLKLNQTSSFLSNHFSQLKNDALRRVMISPAGLLLVNGLPYGNKSSISFQYGGSLNNNIRSMPKKQGELIANLFKMVDSKLTSMNKSLDVSTKANIDKAIARYNDDENKLFKILSAIDTYIDLHDVYKQYDSNNVLNESTVLAFVEARDKSFNKTGTRQQDLLQLFQALIEAVNNKVPGSTTNGLTHTQNL